MEKQRRFIILSIVFFSFSSALYAQGFKGGGYTGPSLEPISIADLADKTANEYVVVSGILARQNLPGRFILVDEEQEIAVSVRIGAYEWVNLEVDDKTPVLIYGIVLKSSLDMEILAERVAFPPSDSQNDPSEPPYGLKRGSSLERKFIVPDGINPLNATLKRA